jgi:hypothetical protein
MEELNPRSATRRDRCTAFSAVTGGDGCHWFRFSFRVPHCVSWRENWPTCRPRAFAGLDCAKREARQKRTCRMTPAAIIKQAAPSQSGYSGQTERRVNRRTR